MANIKEIHKETIIYKDGATSEPIHETHVVREDDHFTHPSTEFRTSEEHHHEGDRHDYRTRREVRHQIVGFRKGAYLILDIIEVILIAEFFIKLFGFSAVNPLVRLINILSYPLYAPFAGFMTPVAPYFVINWSILIAMIVYALLAYIIVALFSSGIRSAYRRH